VNSPAPGVLRLIALALSIALPPPRRTSEDFVVNSSRRVTENAVVDEEVSQGVYQMGRS